MLLKKTKTPLQVTCEWSSNQLKCWLQDYESVTKLLYAATKFKNIIILLSDCSEWTATICSVGNDCSPTCQMRVEISGGE